MTSESADDVTKNEIKTTKGFAGYVRKSSTNKMTVVDVRR